jgi:hypothetical protein
MSRCSPRRLPPTVLVLTLLVACGDGSSTSTGSSSGRVTPGVVAASPTVSTEPFVSAHYGYVVTSDEWTGMDASKAWDGTGSPGDTDSTVDTLEDPEGHAAFAFAEATDMTLRRFADAFRRTNATVHPCPVEPDRTGSITIGHERAILDEMYCPTSGGPFVLTAFVIYAGDAHIFFTYTNAAGNEAPTRSWFGSLLREISFAG